MRSVAASVQSFGACFENAVHVDRDWTEEVDRYVARKGMKDALGWGQQDDDALKAIRTFCHPRTLH